jgi:hypothetical protein
MNCGRMMPKRQGVMDRRQAQEYLSVTTLQFRQLRKNPTFPKPVYDDTEKIEWLATDILKFKHQLNDARKRGWKVPDCLFEWDPTFESAAQQWGRIQEGIRRRRAQISK